MNVNTEHMLSAALPTATKLEAQLRVLAIPELEAHAAAILEGLRKAEMEGE